MTDEANPNGQADTKNQTPFYTQLVSCGHPGPVTATAGARICTMTFAPPRDGKTVPASTYKAMRLTSAELAGMRGIDQVGRTGDGS